MTLTQEKINEIYESNYKYCVYHVMKNSGNKSDGEDNYQNAWVVLLAALSEGKKIETDIGKYLRGINRFLWQSHMRKRKQGDFD